MTPTTNHRWGVLGLGMALIASVAVPISKCSTASGVSPIPQLSGACALGSPS